MRSLGVGIVVAAVALALVAPVQAGSVFWKDTTGATGSFGAGATWDNLQAAITTAQGGGGGGRGEVRIEGNFVRTAGDVNSTLSIAAGGKIDVSGGWNGAWTVQNLATRSLLDDQSNTLATKGRVLGVDAASVTVGNVILKNGGYTALNGGGLYASANATGLRVTNAIVSNNAVSNGSSGGGVYIAANDVKISNSIIANNSMGDWYGSGAGGGVCINNAGTASAPVVLQYCQISSNTGGGDSNGFGAGLATLGTSNALVANSRITANAGFRGNAITTNAAKLTVFGSLIDANASGSGLSLIWASNSSTEGLALVNTTIADNGAATIFVPWSVPGATHPVLLANSIVGVSDPLSVTQSNLLFVTYPSISDAYYPHMRLENTTVSAFGAIVHTTFKIDENAAVNGLAAGLSAQDAFGQYRFHSIDPVTGALIPNPGLGANQEETVAFATADSLAPPSITARTYKYQLLSGSPSIDSGATQSGGSYVYADVNHNNAFDPNLDIVVSGTPPGNALFYYPYDLSFLGRVTYNAGLQTYTIEDGTCLATGLDPAALGYPANRFLGYGIDRGAYELLPPPVPEPAPLAMFLLAFPLVIRRRRA